MTVMAQEPQSVAGERLRPRVRNLWSRCYPSYERDAFEQQIAALVTPEMNVLEIGAGSGRGHQNVFDLRGSCARYVGVDLDPRVLDNPHLDEAFVADAGALPFEDQSFDLVFHKMVAEHLDNPAAALAETARVLKPGGRLRFETPSRFYYPMLIANLTPTSFHRYFVGRFGSGRAEEEVFSTLYRLNDERTIDRLCRGAGLDPEVTFRSTPPGYLRFSAVTFMLGVLYERSAERLFPPLRALIWVSAGKPR
jgi:SAM-dependent methyltransferase